MPVSGDSPSLNPFVDFEELFDLYQLDKDQPLPPEMGACFVPRFEGAVGYREVVNVNPGLSVIIGDLFYSLDTSITHSDAPGIKFHYRLTGSGQIGFDGGGQFMVQQHTCGMLYHSELLLKQEHYLSGQHEQSITLICTPEYLYQQLGATVALLPDEVRRCLSGGRVAPIIHQAVPMRAGISSAAGSLISCEMRGDLRRMFVEAKAMELLALTIEAMVELQGSKVDPARMLPPADVERVSEARRVLEKSVTEQTTITELAVQVGMNESKLMQCFKLMYGETIFDFTQRLRMELARKLLETSDLSITTIALEVGYDYPSNFTTAFKRYFGVPPRVTKAGARHS